MAILTSQSSPIGAALPPRAARYRAMLSGSAGNAMWIVQSRHVFHYTTAGTAEDRFFQSLEIEGVFTAEPCLFVCSIFKWSFLLRDVVLLSQPVVFGWE